LSKKNPTKSTKVALITGINGQDGSYLAELLLAKKYKVFGLVKRGDQNINYVPRGAVILYGDLKDEASIKSAIAESRPDEIYNLAGISDLKTAFEFPEKTLEINFRAVKLLLEESLKINPKVRFLQASSSEIFLESKKPLNEKSPRNWETNNPYARAKMEADKYLELKRKDEDAFACSAILFNHESPRRPERFVTRKITSTLSKIKSGKAQVLELGNLDALRDWGFAGDYVEAMWKVLQAKKPEDFIIATGKTHTIKEFIESACSVLSMKIFWQGEGVDTLGKDKNGRVIVKVNPDFYRPNEKYPKIGDSSKINKKLNWKPKVTFNKLIKLMVEEDLQNISKRQLQIQDRGR
jgi:GDPmannose 4,6-dehydratase